MTDKSSSKTLLPLAWGLLALLILGGAGGAYFYYQLYEESLTLRSALGEATTTLAATVEKNGDLESALTAEQTKNDYFANQIGEISTKVTRIDKLQQTDPQLLAKYSKIYFLNDNYIPKELVDIDADFTYADGKKYQLLPQADKHLEDMIEDAKDDDVNLLVISAYRSFGAQAALKTSYKLTYGSGANAFSADQGYSEHQLGTTIDFTTKELGANFSSFEATKAYEWLTKRASRYGFVLSYPKGNGYYVFEPWHWRYVGLKLADDLHEDGKFFYELEQRAINEYLIDFANEE